MNGSGPTDSVNAVAAKEWLPWDMGIWILFWQGTMLWMPQTVLGRLAKVLIGFLLVPVALWQLFKNHDHVIATCQILWQKDCDCLIFPALPVCMENTVKNVSDSDSLPFWRGNKVAYLKDFTLHASNFNFHTMGTCIVLVMIPWKYSTLF